MIRFGSTSNGSPEIKISLGLASVFLDQFAIKKLAKGDRARRLKFMQAIRGGGDLVFSVSNAAELTGPTGGSAIEIRKFLSELGAHWFPVEMDPKAVSDREIKALSYGPVDGAMHADSIACKNLVQDFFADRLTTHPRGELVDLSPDEFFDLGWFVEKLSRQRESIITGKLELDKILRERILDHRKRHDSDPKWIEKAFPNLAFDVRFPVTFTYSQLMRVMIAEAKSHQIVKNDGIDFGQAVVAASTANLATLDKHWKRRIEKLPQPNKLARIYSESELDLLVRDLEKQVAKARN